MLKKWSSPGGQGGTQMTVPILSAWLLLDRDEVQKNQMIT